MNKMVGAVSRRNTCNVQEISKGEDSDVRDR